jgi:hypothetical protein
VCTADDDDLDDGMIYVNGIDPRTGRYLVTPRLAAEVAARLAAPPADPGRVAAATDLHAAEERRVEEADSGLMAVVAGVDQNKLEESGWAIVFSGRPEHADEVAAIRRELAPLIEHRRAVAGPLFCEYTGDDGVQAESAVAWLSRHGVGAGPADPEVMPFYLLLVGGPAHIPFEFQYRVDVQRAVGRICFDDIGDYRRYADAVVAYETGGRKATKRLELFGPRNRGDKATALSLRRLLQPLQDKLGGRPGWRTASTVEEAATRAALDKLVNDDDPALMLTASHGLGLEADDPQQRVQQGALVCANWKGIGQPVLPGDVFAAQDVAPDADLSGRMAFLFGCFSGGTPTDDDYAHRVDPKAPTRLAAAAFASALPQALLRSGMLAVMAHVDRAWGYSFGTGRADSTPTFRSTLISLMLGNRVGVAFDYFNLRAGELGVDQAEQLGRAVVEKPATLLPFVGTWTSATDARNYVVFGDPAVRLNI